MVDISFEGGGRCFLKGVARKKVGWQHLCCWRSGDDNMEEWSIQDDFHSRGFVSKGVLRWMLGYIQWFKGFT